MDAPFDTGREAGPLRGLRQEEPKNRGAWGFVHERSGEFLREGLALQYVGRAASPSPATGNAGVNKRELERFLAEAFA